MRDLVRLVLVIASGLLVSAASVFGLGDRYILTPPPQNVVEGFLDRFAAGRHDQALRHVLKGAPGARVDSLAVWHRRLTKRIGKFALEETQHFYESSDTAMVAALVAGEGGRATEFAFRVVRSKGSWYLEAVPALDRHWKGDSNQDQLNAR